MTNNSKIHPTAILHPSVKIADGCSVGAYSLIGENTSLGAGTSIGSHTIIERNTSIGRNNRIFSHVNLGGEPNISETENHHHNTQGQLEIGDNNIIREYSVIHRGSHRTPSQVTKLGNNNYIMCFVHLGHDCLLGNYNTLKPNINVGGHCEFGSFNNIVISTFHQFCLVGSYNLIVDSVIRNNIPSYGSYNQSKRLGMNRHLVQQHFSKTDTAYIENLYKKVLRKRQPKSQDS